MTKALALLVALIPSLAFAQATGRGATGGSSSSVSSTGVSVINLSAPKYTATATTGNQAFLQAAGARHCLDNTCTVYYTETGGNFVLTGGNISAPKVSGADFSCTAADCSISVTATGATGVTSGLFPHQYLLRATVPYTAYVTAATKASVTLFALPPRARVLGTYADTTTTYAGLAGTITLGVGDDADGDTTFLLKKDVKTAVMFQGGSKGSTNASDLGTTMLAGGFMWVNTSNQPASSNVYVNINSGTGNVGNGTVTNLTQGSTTFTFKIEILP